jgi:hypothetical protein
MAQNLTATFGGAFDGPKNLPSLLEVRWLNQQKHHLDCSANFNLPRQTFPIFQKLHRTKEPSVLPTQTSSPPKQPEIKQKLQKLSLSTANFYSFSHFLHQIFHIL